MLTRRRQIKMLILGLTGQCNFACAYCYAHEQPPVKMELRVAVRAIDMARAGGGTFVLQLSGGEPLLAFDRLREIVEYVRQNRVPALLQLQTNASLIDREKAEYLRDAGVGIGISLDGRPAQNDIHRCLPSGGVTSPLIMRGAEALAAAGVETGITCVVTADNVRQLSGIVEMAYYLGNVRKIGFDLLRAQGRGTCLKAAGAGELEEALREVLATARRLERHTGRKLQFSHTERVISLADKQTAGFAHCHAMNGEAAFVDAAGEIYACASLSAFPEFRLGNVEDGINAAKQQAVADKIRSSMTFCPQCPSFSLCGGACYARWYGAGLDGRPYPPECALKTVFIEAWQQAKS